MIRAVIFDFDGVLVDSEHTKFSIIQELLKSKGKNLSQEAYPRFIGTKTRAFLDKEYPDLTQQQVDAIVSQWRRSRPTDALIPVMAELIDALHEKDIQLAVVTGSSKKTVKETLGFRAQFFKALITGEDAASKPSPQGYISALRMLGVPKKAVVVLEDSPAGVQAAKATGLTVYAVHPNEIGADQHFSSHEDLCRHVLEIMNG